MQGFLALRKEQQAAHCLHTWQVEQLCGSKHHHREDTEPTQATGMGRGKQEGGRASLTMLRRVCKGASKTSDLVDHWGYFALQQSVKGCQRNHCISNSSTDLTPLVPVNSNRKPQGDDRITSDREASKNGRVTHQQGSHSQSC